MSWSCGRCDVRFSDMVTLIRDRLVPIDLATMAVEEPPELPGAPRAIAAGAAHLWVACGQRGDKASGIVRVRPETGEIEQWAKSEWAVYDLAIAGDRLLTATGLALAGPAAGMANSAAGGPGSPAHHDGHHGGGGHGGGGGH